MIMILTLLKPIGNLLECTVLFLIEMCYFKTLTSIPKNYLNG